MKEHIAWALFGFIVGASVVNFIYIILFIYIIIISSTKRLQLRPIITIITTTTTIITI